MGMGGPLYISGIRMARRWPRVVRKGHDDETGYERGCDIEPHQGIREMKWSPKMEYCAANPSSATALSRLIGGTHLEEAQDRRIMKGMASD